MAQLRAVLFFFICVLCWSWHVPAREIFISEQGSQLPSCLDEHNHVPCQSLVAVSHYVTHHRLNNTVIRINGTHYTLQGVANFSGVENITITGEQTHISCNRTNTSGAGIVFEKSSNIKLQDFTVSNCGVPTVRNLSDGDVSSAIVVHSSSSATISFVKVSCSNGGGLAIINTIGVVQVVNSTFAHNSISYQSQGMKNGGGINIVFDNLHSNHALFVISDCNFTNNTASSHQSKMAVWQYSKKNGGGGGISVEFFNYSHSNKVLLCNISISNNTAIFGGWLYVYHNSGTHNNSITVLDSVFIMNTASILPGGGADVGFMSTTSDPPFGNSIRIQRTLFYSNNALYGGGLSVFIDCVEHLNFNTIIVEDCEFRSNKAASGAAVNVNPKSSKFEVSQCIGTFSICDCHFIGSSDFFFKTSHHAHGSAFWVSKVPVQFSGNVSFTGNTNSALHVTSADVSFTDNSIYSFFNNVGDCGGAIHLVSGSKMIVRTNVTFFFVNNTASLGGAICALMEEIHSFVYTESCFISTKQSETISFNFNNNSALLVGNDIFASSLQSCITQCAPVTSLNVTGLFTKQCIGEFNFDGQNLTKNASDVATYPLDIIFTSNNSELSIIPGTYFNLPVELVDELGSDVTNSFTITVKVHPFNSKMPIALNHRVIDGRNIKIFGKPGWKGWLLLENYGIRRSIGFEISHCPPGFIPENFECICSTKSYRYIRCDNCYASLLIGHWIGYHSSKSEKQLHTGQCVIGLCSQNLSATIQLPRSSEQLEATVCDTNHSGVLCSTCTGNNSVYYHSPQFACRSSDSCHYGIPLYIATDLLPVTLTFLVILLFKVSLTSGALYSFVFFVQMTSLSIDKVELLVVSNNILKHVLHLFLNTYDIFNLAMGNGYHLQFCIVQTKNIMILFMFNYLTVLYAFFLVLATILLLRLHSCYSCVKLCRRCGRRNIRGSIVDGMSAFLVLCYFQCAVTTSRILAPSSLYGIGDKLYKTVPLYNGELEYFKGEHLFYAVPALLCIIFILIPPPTILLLEPLLTWLFSISFFTESRLKWMYNRLRLKLMPFLDSFQACFKDKHRFFAGLYFVYRILFPLLPLVNNSNPRFYFTAQLILFMIAVIHIILQPYKKNWHNILELCIMVDLLFLNSVAYINSNYFLSKYSHILPTVVWTNIVEMFLLSLPLVYLVCYIAVTIYQKVLPLQCCLQIIRRRMNQDLENSEETFPARLLDQFSDNYKTF